MKSVHLLACRRRCIQNDCVEPRLLTVHVKENSTVQQRSLIPAVLCSLQEQLNTKLACLRLTFHFPAELQG